MGNHRWGAPTEVIRALRDRYELGCFVETGTHMGDTSLWAADHFTTVITVELAKEYYVEANCVLAAIRVSSRYTVTHPNF